MPGSLIVDLNEGYRRHAEALPDEARSSLASTREALRGHRRDGGRAARLLALVLAYRSGPKELWAPVLLDVLAPSMLLVLRRLRAQPPYLDEEDVRQQLVVEVLAAASEMPLPPSAPFLRRSLVSRANQGVRRRLAQEAMRQSQQRQLEALEWQSR